MNFSLIAKLELHLKLFGIVPTLVRGDTIAEIKEAARRCGLNIRFVGPQEFSMPAIWQAQRDDPTAVGFWTGLRKALHIPRTVQVLVFRDVDKLDDMHATALESVVKGDMNDPNQGFAVETIWATATSLASFNVRLEGAFIESFTNVPEWLLDLESKAATALSPLRDKVKQWPEGDYACPWLRRYLSKLRGHDPEIVLVLQDWGVANDLERLDQAIDFIDNGDGDRTIQAIIEDEILGPKIHDGRACVLNAVWGLRVSGNRTGYIGTDIHKAAFPIWAETIKRLKPSQVCLCGEWAKWPETYWGELVDGDFEMRRWKDWSSNGEKINPCHFSRIKFCTIPHPSAWTFSFADFAKSLKF